MHFIAEAASQNTKPVQCFICLKYGHIAKYCKTKQQVCARCGDNHRIEQCTVASDAVKCCNCKGNHIATSNDCSLYREQETKMLNMVNRYSTTSKQATLAPAIYNTTDFPTLPNVFQQQKEILQSSLFNDIPSTVGRVIWNKMRLYVCLFQVQKNTHMKLTIYTISPRQQCRIQTTSLLLTGSSTNQVISHSEFDQSGSFELGVRPIRFFWAGSSANQVISHWAFDQSGYFSLGVQPIRLFWAGCSANEIISHSDFDQSGFF